MSSQLTAVESLVRPGDAQEERSTHVTLSTEQFREAYLEELPNLCNTLHRLGVGASDLEDLAHDVFATALRRLAAFDARRPIRPWLFGIALRLAADFRVRAHHRREVGEPPPEREDPRPRAPEQLQAAQDRALVLAALDELPFERRSVFVLHEIEELPIPEAAKALDIPVNTAYSRLRVARREFTEAVRRLRPRRE